MITYEIKAPEPASHLFHISLVIDKPAPEGQSLALPNWIPGSYLIRDFARMLYTPKAFSVTGNQPPVPIDIMKTSSNEWVCGKTTGPLRIEYKVYAYDHSVRGSYLDEMRAFINPCTLLLQVLGDASQPCVLNLVPPDIPDAKEWRVATTLRTDNAQKWSFGRYYAHNYEELIDSPIEMGRFELLTFTVADTEHYVAITDNRDGDSSRLIDDLPKICAQHIALFAPQPPFNCYLFLMNFFKDGYGGLEHRNSTAIITQRDALPVPADRSLKPSYLNLLGLLSHEYFHAWNIKRIKPQSFLPYDLNHKNYTTQLWVFEGFTAYYDNLALVRAKIITPEQYLDLIAVDYTKYLRTAGAKEQTLVESSFDAWIKFYQPHENSANSGVSYYIKGSLVALILDLSLRKCDAGHSLDTVMRLLWQEYGAKQMGVPEKKVEELLIQLGNGTLTTLVHTLLYTTEDIPLDEILSDFGMKLNRRTALNQEDMGGKKTVAGSLINGYFGWMLSPNQSRVMVSSVLTNSPALRAGIWAQDEIVAINNSKVDATSIDKVLKRLVPQQKVIIHIFRVDTLLSKECILGAPPYDTAEITINPEQTPEQKRTREQWLS